MTAAEKGKLKKTEKPALRLSTAVIIIIVMLLFAAAFSGFKVDVNNSGTYYQADEKNAASQKKSILVEDELLVGGKKQFNVLDASYNVVPIEIYNNFKEEQAVKVWVNNKIYRLRENEKQGLGDGSEFSIVNIDAGGKKIFCSIRIPIEKDEKTIMTRLLEIKKHKPVNLIRLLNSGSSGSEEQENAAATTQTIS